MLGLFFLSQRTLSLFHRGVRGRGGLVYKEVMHTPTRLGLRGFVPLLGFLGFWICVAPAAVAAPPPGFTPLFNGKDLAGWRGWAIHADGGKPPELEQLSKADRQRAFAAWTADAARHWTVRDGELINDGSGAYLATDEDYGDYELLVDYMALPESDSGIYLKNTPQVQIEDAGKDPERRPGGLTGSGGLFNNGDWPGKEPLMRADKPFGEWNTFRILQLGERTTVYLNDMLVVDQARLRNFWNSALPLPRRGRILLQTHGGEIRWRNIFIREIGSVEANALLAKNEGAGFEPVFNGRDFTGWQGAVDAFEVVDGAIRCKPKAAGNIYTSAEYSDFAVSLEFKMPPKGNNGLAIRYPGGQVNAGREGMTEIQILDDGYEGIDPRQVHGSAYGMVGAVGGYQRPHGEWNHQLVTVKGSHVTVELNGTTILDADLAPVTQFMDDKPHPGKERSSGFFGFCGHADAVEFRGIRIKRITKLP
jgi:hypothetical protein